MVFRGSDVNKGSHKVRDLIDARHGHGQTRQTRASLAKASNKVVDDVTLFTLRSLSYLLTVA